MNVLLQETKENMKKAVEAMENKLANIRAGRANPAMLDHVMVDYYGVPTPIRNIASISVPEAKELKIKPFDKSSLGAIEKAIVTANLGIMPTNNGEMIILVIPALTEETRKGYVKDAKAIGEEGKVAIRNIRQKSIKDLEAMDLSEDDIKHGEKRIQDLVHEINAEVDHILKAKEQDLMSI